MASPDPAAGPVALVTGANRGTGLAIARELHSRGCRVIALNRSRLGEPWLTEFPCDLGRPEAVQEATDAALRAFGRLDICVTNAVARVLEPIADMDPAVWREAVSVNLDSVFQVIHATLPAMRESGGVYVLMGSHAGTHFFEGGAAYSATKAAMKAIAETLLLEERVHGVRATLVSPGAIANHEDDHSAYKMAPESVARFVAALALDQPADTVVGDIEIRPSRLPLPREPGIARLQHV